MGTIPHFVETVPFFQATRRHEEDHGEFVTIAGWQAASVWEAVRLGRYRGYRNSCMWR
jgi:hypothetical protein